MSRYIPADVRRELRKETNFGCAICGIPIIEYHHIIPFSDKQHHDPNHMIALCPTHHRPSDDNAITKRDLYDLKKNPHNNDIVDYIFYYKSKLPELELGGSGILFSEPGKATILRINKEDIIGAQYNDPLLSFDVKFFSKSDELIAEINNNDWWADTNEVWDLQYKSNEFKVYNADERLGLRVRHEPDSGLISIIGIFRHGGDSVNIHRSRIYFPSANAIESGVNHLLGEKEQKSIKGGPYIQQQFAEVNDNHPVIYEVVDGEYWMGGKN